MEKLTFIFLMICSSIIYAQTLCDGVPFVSLGTFNVCNTDPWVLVFEDNFNGDSLDLSKWSYGWRNLYCNDEQQYYTSGDNIEVSNGTLKLIAKRDTIYARAVDWLPDDEILYCGLTNRGQNARYFYYTSGNIQTIRTFSYGKFEARIKIPKGKGFWPAFWMFGGDPVYNEIDVFEFVNENDNEGNYDSSKLSKVHHMTIHYDFDGDGNKSQCATKYTGVDFSQDFHVFSLIWDENKIEWYVDGILKRTDYKYYTTLLQPTGCTINANMIYILNKIYTKDPMYIILNLAIQSGSNSPNSSTPFPSQMEVDWVKYYQRNPCQDVNIADASQYPLDIKIFPNPNEGSFIVDFGSKDYRNYNIAVTDMEGKLIKSFKELNSSTLNIDLSDNTKGVYVLYLLNNQDKNIITHKIILQ